MRLNTPYGLIEIYTLDSSAREFDLARIYRLRKAVIECKTAINQSLRAIAVTRDAIARLDRLQRPDISTEHYCGS